MSKGLFIFKDEIGGNSDLPPSPQITEINKSKRISSLFLFLSAVFSPFVLIFLVLSSCPLPPEYAFVEMCQKCQTAFSREMREIGSFEIPQMFSGVDTSTPGK